MSDIVNERVDAAQQELQKRADRLRKIIESKGKNRTKAFDEGAKIVAEMISGQSKLIDKLVFKAPKTAIEQMRNLQLATGNMNQTPAQGIKTTTDAIDSMLEALEQLGR